MGFQVRIGRLGYADIEVITDHFVDDVIGRDIGAEDQDIVAAGVVDRVTPRTALEGELIVACRRVAGVVSSAANDDVAVVLPLAWLHPVNGVVPAEADKEVAEGPDSAQGVRPGRAAPIDFELRHVELTRPVHVDDLELVVIGRGQLAVLHIGKIAIHAHGIRGAVVNGHVTAGPGHDREGQLVETDPLAERHHVRADIGFRDDVCAVAKVEVVGVRTAAAAQGVVALARRDVLVRARQRDGVRPGRADDVLHADEAMLARRPISRAPARNAA